MGRSSEGAARALQGVYQVREKEGVWQIASGFEADARRVEAALGALKEAKRPARPAPEGLAPPPGNPGSGGAGVPFAIVTPPETLTEVTPEYPEEAGRARLIGEARLDLGMRRAAIEAALRWRFAPARLADGPLTVVEEALHEARVGELAGPVRAEGLFYLLLKRGEIYYALRPRPDGEMSYQILHQKHAPEGERLKRAVEGDIADYLAESRRQAYMNEAARLMGIHQVSDRVGRLEIRTDVLDENEIATLGRAVEAAVRAQESLWAPWGSLRPFNQQILVYAWARETDHDRLHRMWQAGRTGASAEPQPSPPSPASRAKVWSFTGEYIPASRILSVPCERMGGHLPVPILIHEAVHMLDYERVYGAGVRPSQWFEEGLATYFGFSQIGARLNIESGDIRRSATIISGPVRLQFDPRTPIRDDGPTPLRALLQAGAGDPLWIGDQRTRAYGASWTLVHFLLHGAKGARREAFGEYARAEAQGRGGFDAFVRLLGPDLGPLEDAWHRYEEDL